MNEVKPSTGTEAGPFNLKEKASPSVVVHLQSSYMDWDGGPGTAVPGWCPLAAGEWSLVPEEEPLARGWWSMVWIGVQLGPVSFRA